MHILAILGSEPCEEGRHLPALPWLLSGPSQMGSAFWVHFTWEDSLPLAGLGLLASSVQLERHCPLWWLELCPRPWAPEAQHWLWPVSHLILSWSVGRKLQSSETWGRTIRSMAASSRKDQWPSSEQSPRRSSFTTSPTSHSPSPAVPICLKNSLPLSDIIPAVRDSEIQASSGNSHPNEGKVLLWDAVIPGRPTGTHVSLS